MQRRGAIDSIWFLVAAVLLAVGGVTYYLLRGPSEAPVAVMTAPVVRSSFAHDVVERGEVESSNNVEIRCEVKSRNSSGTSILEVVPEGTYVKAGDVLVKLDASALEQERTQQLISLNNSKALVIQAQAVYEAALIARKEYLEGTFLQEEQLQQSAVFVAEENLRRAQLSLKSSERLAASGLVTPLQLEADRFAVDKASQELESARTKLRVLREYTKAKMLKQFDSDIRSAEAKWDAEKSSFALEESKLKDLEVQIAGCIIKAPSDGQVKYANTSSGRNGGSDFVVEAGAVVRERQAIIRLPDPKQMQVRAKVNESRVARILVGQKVTVKVDAFMGLELPGEVIRVNEYPEPPSWSSANVKEYATLVRIVDPPEGLRPGLTASVTIHVTDIPNALQVPVQAILEHGGKHYCLVPQGDRFQAREVTLGPNNDSFVVIESGLTGTEQVAMNPRGVPNVIDLPEIESGAEQIVKAVEQSGEATAVGNGAAGQDSNAKKTPGQEAVAAGPTGDAASGAPPREGSPPPSGASKSGRADPSAIFQRMLDDNDANGDGKLQLSELPEDRRDRFAAADANGDGVLEVAEMRASFARRRAGGEGGVPPGGSFSPGGPGAGQ